MDSGVVAGLMQMQKMTLTSGHERRNFAVWKISGHDWEESGEF